MKPYEEELNTDELDMEKPAHLQMHYHLKYEPRAGANADWRNPKHQVMMRIWQGTGKVKATAFPLAFNMTTQTEDDFKVLLNNEMHSALEHF